MNAGGKNGKNGKNDKGEERDARRHVRGSHAARHRTEPSGSVEEVAAQLAPLEEQTAARESGAKNGGAIVVDTGTLNLPEGIVEKKEKKRLLLGFEPVVLIIVALALVFILFIAWQISQMPATTPGG
ncbi:MAG: hypothetical protein QOF61_415 [Acidobacteriota bacterium]|jgi:hypothetical protein|nr:hypothetical protein [Acidobacteriota bacterium]